MTARRSLRPLSLCRGSSLGDGARQGGGHAPRRGGGRGHRPGEADPRPGEGWGAGPDLPGAGGRPHLAAALLLAGAHPQGGAGAGSGQCPMSADMQTVLHCDDGGIIYNLLSNLQRILDIPGPGLVGGLRPAGEAAPPAPLPGAGPAAQPAGGETRHPRAQTAQDNSSIQHRLLYSVFSFKAGMKMCFVLLRSEKNSISFVICMFCCQMTK